MTTQEMITVLTEWRDTIHAAESSIKRHLSPMGLTPESPLYEIPWKLMDAYTKTVSALVGDECEWLSWYWADNEMGGKAMESRVGDKTIKVRTLRHLARCIRETK